MEKHERCNADRRSQVGVEETEDLFVIGMETHGSHRVQIFAQEGQERHELELTLPRRRRQSLHLLHIVFVIDKSFREEGPASYNGRMITDLSVSRFYQRGGAIFSYLLRLF